MREEAEVRFKAECSFQPGRKKLEKYAVGSNMIRRN